jgi:cobaltochelatase CobN
LDTIDRKLVLIIDPAAPQAAVDKLHALKAEGYRVEKVPADGDALMRALLADEDDEMFQRGDYGMYFATLPRDMQDSVNQRWGAPERDPAFRESRLDCGAFAMRAIRCGNIVVALPPLPDLPPPHGVLAFYAWIADGIRAHAIVNLSARRLPEAPLCPVPVLA